MIDQYIKKLKIFDLEFESSFYYIQKDYIVEKIKFNNRTLYSKFEKIERFTPSLLVQQHLNREIIVGVPLIVEKSRVDYIVLEYIDDRQLIFLIRHILKLIGIRGYQTYRGAKNIIQTFISTKGLDIEDIFYLLDRINQFLVEKNIHKCRVLPSKNIPKELNIATLPIDRLDLERGL